MRYMLLIYGDEELRAQAPPEAVEMMYEQYAKFGAELDASGKRVSDAELRPSSTATMVRVEGDETITSDGPFAETKEQLGGFYVIEADDLDEAIEWAAKVPSSRFGPVEVRPVAEGPQ